jgi:hypothetical protein
MGSSNIRHAEYWDDRVAPPDVWPTRLVPLLLVAGCVLRFL